MTVTVESEFERFKKECPAIFTGNRLPSIQEAYYCGFSAALGVIGRLLNEEVAMDDPDFRRVCDRAMALAGEALSWGEAHKLLTKAQTS